MSFKKCLVLQFLMNKALLSTKQSWIFSKKMDFFCTLLIKILFPKIALSNCLFTTISSWNQLNLCSLRRQTNKDRICNKCSSILATKAIKFKMSIDSLKYIIYTNIINVLFMSLNQINHFLGHKSRLHMMPATSTRMTKIRQKQLLLSNSFIMFLLTLDICSMFSSIPASKF